ncbi:PREDICTED: uncharacterized protein LOC109218506 [Nicotiana attenuata]|uniref:EamA domain-containing protein n=1 Tax=Nicotiana attenuata TaxID=49451 RepID=A0A1J6KG13_NICAT|nr:PREDICTED: uncharacterized protein LOC109218506 [Nicotiana attenuata]OIT21747.1 hypothetical protein A4A49_34273 [Nicotiana attenuata]
MPIAEPMNGDGSTRIGVNDIEDAIGVVEMVGPSSISAVDSSSTAESSISICDDDQIAPLLTQSERPKINIFTISYPTRQKLNKEEVIKVVEPDKSPFLQFIIWLWSGSRYSGLLCMVLSSIIYSTMGVVSDVFTAQSVPLFEIAFARCTVVLILSFVWLRRSGQPIFGPTSARKLLVLRALTGYISLMSFIYSIQRLPLSQAIILSFTAPIMASTVARVTLHEKLKIAEIGGLASSFFGLLFIFQPMVKPQGAFPSSIEASESHFKGSHHIFAVLVGLFSSAATGVTYCLTRAGAKAADQPVLPVFSFVLFASPAAVMSTFAFENFVLPSFYSFLLMAVLGVLAFFAEITLARGLQLEKTSRVANIQFIEAALSQFLGMGSSRIIPSIGRLFGCIIILISACCTMYIGPEKEIE